jgi:MFS family permease
LNTAIRPDQRPRHFIGWRIAVLATITGAMTGPGQTIGVSVFVDPMIAGLDLTRSQVSTAYLIGTLVGAAALLPVGRWIDRVGSRRGMTWIGLAFGVGLVAMSGVRGFVTLAIGFTLIRWLGQGSLGLVSVVAITHWFERKRGAVFGVSFTVVSALMALTPVFLGFAIDAYDWRTAWLIAAVVVWLVVMPIARLGIVDRPSDVGQHPDGGDAPTAASERIRTSESRTRREALGEVRFWLLNLAVAVTGMLVTALNFHQISILGEEGFTATEAATMFLPQVVGAVVAGLVVGALADVVQARFLVAMSMGILVCSLLLINFIQPGWQVLLYAVMLGASAGAQRPLVATLLPRWYGTVHIGAIQGVSTLIGVAASAVGPLTLALASAWLGGYTEAAQLLAVLPFVIGLASLAISEPEFEPRSATPLP